MPLMLLAGLAAEPAPVAVGLGLALHVEADALRVAVHNPTDQPLRVWQLGNSWGDGAWSLRVSACDAPDTFAILRPTNQGYTRNVPVSIEIPPRGAQELRLVPSGPAWKASADTRPLAGGCVRVTAVLDLVPSPEATAQGVLPAHLESAPVESLPPHGWLF